MLCYASDRLSTAQKIVHFFSLGMGGDSSPQEGSSKCVWWVVGPKHTTEIEDTRGDQVFLFFSLFFPPLPNLEGWGVAQRREIN